MTHLKVLFILHVLTKIQEKCINYQKRKWMKLKSKILVTGGAGYIGTELVSQLLNSGYQVTVLDKNPFDEQVKYIQGDLQNPARCVMGMCRQEFVIHLAAKPRIPESFINPDEYFDNNVTGTRNILTAASAVGIRKFVFASSSSIWEIVQHHINHIINLIH